MTAPDELSITGIECRGYHGVFGFERQLGQRFVIDLTMGLDTRLSAAVDELSLTLDYATLVDQVKKAVESDPVNLIETLAQRIADLALGHHHVEWVRVTVHKPEAPIDATFSDVAVTITRTRG